MSVLEAHQWFKNGDHPDDNLLYGDRIVAGERTEGKLVRYFRHPGIPGITVCAHCGNTLHVHGWIDCQDNGRTVCPGDWIVILDEGQAYALKPDLYEALTR